MIAATHKYSIAFTKEDSSLIAFECKHVWLKKDSYFYIGVEQERTNYGSAFVQSLWFHRPVCLRQEDGELIYCNMIKCHIVGREFSEVLMQYRSLHPGKDLDAVWELQTIPYSYGYTKENFPTLTKISTPFQSGCHLC